MVKSRRVKHNAYPAEHREEGQRGDRRPAAHQGVQGPGRLGLRRCGDRSALLHGPGWTPAFLCAAGLGVFVGPTAGYLYSWPIAAFVIGLLTQATWRRFNLGYAFLANVVGGILVVYAIGVPFTSLYADVPLATSFVGSLSV